MRLCATDEAKSGGCGVLRHRVRAARPRTGRRTSFHRAGGPAPGSARSVLRHLPQRSAENRAALPRARGSRHGRRSSRALGKSRAEAACGRDAAAGREAAAAGGLRRLARLAGNRNRSESPARQPGQRRAPPAEPHRVRQRGARPAGPRHRRGHAAAAGRFGPGLRQHRRLADDLADAARVLHDRSRARRTHGDRLLEDADRGDLSRAGRHVAEPARRGAAARHARRDDRAPRLPRRRRIQVLDPELRHRQLHSRRTARAHHRRRARPRLQVPGRRAEPGHVGRRRRLARRDDPRQGRLARRRRDVSREELPPQPRHDPAVRSQVAREQQHPAAAVLPRDRVPARPGSVCRPASRRLPQPAEDPDVPSIRRGAGRALRARDPDDAGSTRVPAPGHAAGRERA